MGKNEREKKSKSKKGERRASKSWCKRGTTGAERGVIKNNMKGWWKGWEDIQMYVYIQLDARAQLEWPFQ